MGNTWRGLHKCSSFCHLCSSWCLFLRSWRNTLTRTTFSWLTAWGDPGATSFTPWLSWSHNIPSQATGTSQIRNVSEMEKYKIRKEVFGPYLTLFINIFAAIYDISVSTRLALVFFLGHVKVFCWVFFFFSFFLHTLSLEEFETRVFLGQFKVLEKLICKPKLLAGTTIIKMLSFAAQIIYSVYNRVKLEMSSELRSKTTVSSCEHKRWKSYWAPSLYRWIFRACFDTWEGFSQL